MSRSFFLAAAILASLALPGVGCEENVYQVIDRTESLDDPGVMPAVVYTYPEMNSSGPYPDFYVGYCGYEYCSYYSMIQVRFNKFMDVTFRTAP